MNMSKENVARALAYYQAMNNKNLAEMEKYLHPEVQFIGPMANMTGKKQVLESAGRFIALFKTLTTRAQFGSGDQVMLANDLDCPDPIGFFRVAALLTFKDNLIKCIELFYDARVLEKKKDEIFSQK
jgi:hypothetical protein